MNIDVKIKKNEMNKKTQELTKVWTVALGLIGEILTGGEEKGLNGDQKDVGGAL